MNERIRDLFAAPPAEFVRARDSLAKELRAAGREGEAKEVSALRRPTAALWAVNQLARKNKADLEHFLDASERVRHAQVRGASGDDLRTAMAAQRAALAKLEQAAAETLRDSGAQPSPAALRTVQSTLQAAGSGPDDVRQQLLHGVLPEALEASGFEALLAAAPVRGARHPPTAAPSREAKSSHAGGAAREAKKQERQNQRAAEREQKRQAAEERKRAKAASAAEKRVRQLEARAKAAEEAARRARDAVVEARAALDRLRS